MLQLVPVSPQVVTKSPQAVPYSVLHCLPSIDLLMDGTLVSVGVSTGGETLVDSRTDRSCPVPTCSGICFIAQPL